MGTHVAARSSPKASLGSHFSRKRGRTMFSPLALPKPTALASLLRAVLSPTKLPTRGRDTSLPTARGSLGRPGGSPSLSNSVGPGRANELLWLAHPTSPRSVGRAKLPNLKGTKNADAVRVARIGMPRRGRNKARFSRRSRRLVREMAHPFVAATNAYLAGVRAYYSESTLERARRDLRTIRLDMEQLAASGKVSTFSPRALSEHDIEALLVLWRTRTIRRRGRDRPLSLASQAHLLKTLNNLLCYNDNNIVGAMKRKKHVRMPKELTDTPIRVLSASELERVRRAADGFEGWRGSVVRFLVAFLPATGLRPKEVRLARFEDMDLDSWTIAVAHPKGERSWASAGHRTVILPSAEEAVRDLLRDRAELLKGRTCEWLIPMPKGWYGEGQEFVPWPDACLRKMASDLREASGVRFAMKDMRSTFAQTAKDADVSIEAVSRAMRHKSTKTTERYYARMRPEQAFRELREKCATPAVTR